jgi:predicted SnoaL-like aldol condensation-catalyzing enzyme
MASADGALTQRNKALVREFYTTVLINSQVDAAPQFLRADYIRHDPNVPTGLKGFMDAFHERFAQKPPPDYKRELLNVVGENDLVVIFMRQTWTSRDGQHKQALGSDMFRVQGARLQSTGMQTADPRLGICIRPHFLSRAAIDQSGSVPRRMLSEYGGSS